MIKIISAFFILVSLSKTSIAQTVIKNTNVVDVINRKILSGYDVAALAGKIISVEKAKATKYAEGVTVIDGTGKYLIPGLNDAHVHFFQSGSIFTRPDAIDLRKFRAYNTTEVKYVHDNMEDFLRRYMAAGITSVIDVGSTYHFLNQRDSFANRSYAPKISMTGALLTTYIPPAFKDLGDDSPFILMKTEDSVRQSVRELKAGKADFIKIWYIVLDGDKEKGARKNLPLVQAVIDEAHKNNMRVAVHATEMITAQLAVEAGADYLVHNVEDSIVTPAFLDLLKKKHTVLCPTMVVGRNYRRSFGHNYSFSTDELSLANPMTVASIINFPEPDTALGNRLIKSMNSPRNVKLLAHGDSVLAINLKKLNDAGIIIAAGTDAGNIGTQHASSYFTELKAMEDAGLSTWDLLVSATINGAKAIGKQELTGSITKGKDADMALLTANPLEGLANWRKIDRVISRGVAILPETLIKSSPEMLVQQQLNGYNAHDINAFLEPFDEHIQVYNLSGKLLLEGKDRLRKMYTDYLKVPGLHCRLVNRIAEGNMVVDHEAITGEGMKPLSGISMYRVENGKITRMYFVD